jgi:two-component system catabolic regulation response regulator CreB/two-component system response regulator ChvI
MPKMNGFELYREIKNIRKDKVSKNVKVCFIIAYEVYYEQLKEEFPKMDIACFIKKPISGTDLIKRIKQELVLE